MTCPMPLSCLPSCYPGNEWRAHCPVLSSPAQLLWAHAFGFFYGGDPSHIWSPLSLLPVCPALPSFQKTLHSPVVPAVGQPQLSHFCLQQCFRLSLLQDPLVCLSICKSLSYFIVRNKILHYSVINK